MKSTNYSRQLIQLALLQRQKTQIDDLTARIAALENAN
jgi:hypothetical protein